MKPWLLAFAALAAVPTAFSQSTTSPQDAVAALPSCASDCFKLALAKSPCQPTNATCICTNPTLQQTMQGCVWQSCEMKEALSSMNLTATDCGRPIRDKSPELIIITTVLGTLAAAFVLQRLLYKLWAKLGLGADDYVTLGLTLWSITSTVMNTHVISKPGLGRDIWTLTPLEITRFNLYFWFLEWAYFVQVCLLKLSLLLFYIRIFPSPEVRRLLWGTFIFSIIYGLIFTFVAIFQCTPVKYYWERWDGEHDGKCFDINAVAWSNAAISIAIDIWVLAIPLWQLRSLNLDWRRKIGVGVMFCLGAFVTVMSIMRLKSLIQFGNDSLNPTWDFLEISIWSIVEINVGLICVCLPAFRLLLVRIFPKLQGTTERYYGKNSRRNRTATNPRSSRLPLGHSAGSQVDRSQPYPNIEGNRIGYQTSYTVEYGETDEVQLVTFNDKFSARSDIRSEAS